MEKRTVFKTDERDYREEILDLIRSDRAEEEKRLLLCDYHDNDIASAFEALSAEETVELYPYGCAKLRMTEIPLV